MGCQVQNLRGEVPAVSFSNVVDDETLQLCKVEAQAQVTQLEGPTLAQNVGRFDIKVYKAQLVHLGKATGNVLQNTQKLLLSEVPLSSQIREVPLA